MTAPSDPRLAAIAASLGQTRMGAELWDPQWRLAWVSDEIKAVLGEQDEQALMYGRHAVEVRFSKLWTSVLSNITQGNLLEFELGYVAHGTHGGADRIRELYRRMTGLDEVPAFEEAEPPPLWGNTIELTIGGQPPFPVQYIATRLHDERGELFGTAYLYGTALPARLVALVTRGNEAMFERMAALVEPGRRTAAVLFADLQASGPLSRRLPSAAYFELIASLTTEMDKVVIANGGIVGKHAGDGVTAFFLTDEFGSASACAAGAINAAHELRATAMRVAADLAERTGLFEAADCALNIGLHWGGTLYMGQVVTGGRLEVTALGDEVNEGARIQQSACDGAVLASKALIERLGADDGRRVGVDPEAVVYTTIAELDGADPKAVRDAGTLPVTELFADEREAAARA